MHYAIYILSLLVFLQALYTFPVSKAAPTLCESIATEVMNAVDRGDITHQDALAILHRCSQLHPPTE